MIETNLKIPVVVSKEFVTKYTAACRKFPSIEWSGVCYYKMEGTALDNLKIRLFDFVPLTADTSAHTFFNYGTEHLQYAIEQNILGDDLQFGDIHSHNVMKVFFSGTDNADLVKNTKHYSFFLSVVVNNAGDIIAKVCQNVKTQITATNNGVVSVIKETSDIAVADAQIIFEDATQIDEIFLSYLNKIVPAPPPQITYKTGIPGVQQRMFDDWEMPAHQFTKKMEEPKVKLTKVQQFIAECLMEDFSSYAFDKIVADYDFTSPLSIDDLEDYCEENKISIIKLKEYLNQSIGILTTFRATNLNVDYLLTNIKGLLKEFDNVATGQ